MSAHVNLSNELGKRDKMRGYMMSNNKGSSWVEISKKL